MLRTDFYSKHYFDSILIDFCADAVKTTATFESAFTKIEQILTQAATESIALDEFSRQQLPLHLTTQINSLHLDSVFSDSESLLSTKLPLRPNYTSIRLTDTNSKFIILQDEKNNDIFDTEKKAVVYTFPKIVKNVY